MPRRSRPGTATGIDSSTNERSCKTTRWTQLNPISAHGQWNERATVSIPLAIDVAERTKAIRQLESESRQKHCTQIFIETPYRNNQLLETLTKTLHPQTMICVAADLTSSTETVQTKTAQQWKTAMPQLHKRPAIFLVYSGD